MAAYRRVGIVANPQRPEAPEAARAAIDWLRARGVEVRGEPGLEGLLGADVPAFDWTRIAEQVDLLLTFGGDGTILFAARSLAGASVPIFGVNTGHLGFLTSSSRADMERSLEALLTGRGRTERHMTLEARVRRRGSGAVASGDSTPTARGLDSGASEGEVDEALFCLNDVVLHKGGVTVRVLDLLLEVDGEEVGTYVADGLILATPVGSTGYTLSAQGPLVAPRMEAILATPICPHTLAVRPLVLPPDATIRVHVQALQEPASLAVDGSVVRELDAGDRVDVRRGAHAVHLVRLPDRNFFALLRAKLHWGERGTVE